MRRLVHSIVCLSLGFIVACGGDGPVDNQSDPPQVLNVSPNPIVEGQAAILTGTGFSSVIAANTVTMDNVELDVTAASATSLTVTIPPGCGPLRPTNLRVRSDGVISPAFATTVAPDPTGDAIQNVELAVGEQVVFRQPRHCLGLPTNGGTAEYLIGIQSTGRNGGFTRDILVSGITAAAPVPAITDAQEAGPATGPAASQTSSMASGSFDPLASSRYQSSAARLLQRHRERHVAAMAGLVRPVLDPVVRVGAPSLAGAPARVVVTGLENIGDMLDLRIRKLGGGCDTQDTNTVTVRLAAKTTRSMWWVDVANPDGGFTDAELDALGQFFDDVIWEGDIAEFGPVQDIDGNGRIVIVMSEKLNAEDQLLGFVNPCDLFPRDDATGLVASNEGEFFYALAPDPEGTVGDTVTVSELQQTLPFVIAHEFAHIIQFSRRATPTELNPMSQFVAEGQATLAEEIIGHLALGNTTGSNLDFVVAFDRDEVQAIDWYFSPFVDLVYYFGWPGDTLSARTPGAPSECTWIDADVDQPCGGRPLWYGVTWSFLRWASDLYGDALGGEDVFQQALIDSDLTGFDNLEAALISQGPLEDHLARWAATLYMDDRPGASAENSMSSWDLLSMNAGLRPTAWLNPETIGFIDFARSIKLRDPSVAYFLVGGSGGASSYSVRVGTPTGVDLDAAVQVWVVRTQ